MDKEHSESYNPDACCGDDCYAIGMNDNEPCWGDVSVVSEETYGDDWYWVHACQGHYSTYDCYGCEYKPEPEQPKEKKVDPPAASAFVERDNE